MGRRVHIIHLKTGERARESNGGRRLVYHKMLCGEESSIASFVEELDGSTVTCRRCSQLIGKKQLEELASQGTNVETKRRDVSDSYDLRSAYELLINGESVGRIEIDYGWGKRWRLVDLAGERVAYACSREVAMAAAPAFLDEGKLVSQAVLEERRRQWEAKQTARREKERSEQEARKRAQAEQRERNERAAKTLEALRSRLGGTLTNIEVDAIVTAVVRLRDDQ